MCDINAVLAAHLVPLRETLKIINCVGRNDAEHQPWRECEVSV